MPGQMLNNSDTVYLRIVGGNLVQKVDKDTPHAKRREYETKDGGKGEKWELVYMNWEGIIRGIEFKDSDYGRNCLIYFDDAVLTLGTGGRYFQDLASRLCGADLSKPVTLHPYNMETDSGTRSGVVLYQDGEKLFNYFYDGEKQLHGFPEVNLEEKEEMGKNYWKSYFLKTETFLVKKLKELEFEKPKNIIQDDEVPGEDDYPKDLPFN